MKSARNKLTVIIRVPYSPELNQIYEGIIPLADIQQNQIQSIIGDGKAEVVIGVDMQAKDFGQGGGVFVSVKLTCHQDDAMLDYAAQAAARIAQKHLAEQFEIHSKLLQQRGLIK